MPAACAACCRAWASRKPRTSWSSCMASSAPWRAATAWPRSCCRRSWPSTRSATVSSRWPSSLACGGRPPTAPTSSHSSSWPSRGSPRSSSRSSCKTCSMTTTARVTSSSGSGTTTWRRRTRRCRKRASRRPSDEVPLYVGGQLLAPQMGPSNLNKTCPDMHILDQFLTGLLKCAPLSCTPICLIAAVNRDSRHKSLKTIVAF
mmetsp:Transcript_18146/g.57908  ORF Transcript_18146/g.57908 Transcript_18146/m.57908 type:complete len:203 (-) Transcript_18146:8-616(-)